MATVIATVGSIPGAGTTTTVANLGSALAEQRRQVAVVDATTEGSRVGDVLSVSGGGDVTDVLRRNAALGDVTGTGPHGLAVLPGSEDTSWGDVRPNAIETAYDRLRDRFEFVLVDCGSELSPATAGWLGHADEVIVVTDPDVPDATADAVAIADAFDVDVRGIVANRVRTTDVDDAVADLGETDQRLLAVLPEDPTASAAGQDAVSVLSAEPDSEIASCIWRLALRLRTEDHDDPVVPGGSLPEDARRATHAQDEGAAPSSSPAGTAGTAQGHGEANPDDADAGGVSADDGGSVTDDRSETTTSDDQFEAATNRSSEAAAADEAESDAASTGSKSTGVTSDGETLEASSESGFGSGDSAWESATPSERDDEGDDATGTAVGTERGATRSSESTGDAGIGTSAGASANRERTREERSTDRDDDAGRDDTGGGDDSKDFADADDTNDGERDADDGISDEEIEAVFKETMERVKRDKAAAEENALDEDDESPETSTDGGEDGNEDANDGSVLGGFMGK